MSYGIRGVGMVLLVIALAAGGAPAQEGMERGGFVQTSATGDTVSVERFTRTAERLESELRAGGMRIAYDADLAPDATVREIRASFGPEVRAVVAFRGDSAFAEVSGARTPARQHFRPGAGALPYVNLSAAILEQVVRRAMAIGGASVRVPMLDLGGGQTFGAEVTRTGPDAVRIRIPPDVDIELRVDGEGRVLEGAVPSQGIRIERTGG